MPVGFYTVHKRLTEIIRAIKPAVYDRDEQFICLEDDEGTAPEVTDPLAGDRYFDIRIDEPPYDAGYTGQNGDVLRVVLEIRVRYNLKSRAQRTRKAGTDGGLITRAVLDPCKWDGANSGIRTMVPPGRGDVDIEYGEEDEEGEDEDTLLLKILLVVEYLEQNGQEQ